MKNNNEYPWQGMLAVTGMGLAGILFIYATGFFNVTSFDEFYDCFYKNGLVLIFCLFFIVISIICWISFFLNVVVKPKKEILYLSKIEDGSSVFINKKGKKFYFDGAKYKVKKYYYVLKTHGDIKKVLSETNETFGNPKEKRSYWLNCYTPKGNYENIFLLPIFYIILLPGILSFIMSKGNDKIYGAIWCFVPVYGIIYDLVYKIKLKNNNYKKIDESAFQASYDGLLIALEIIAVLVINIILFFLFIKSDNIGKLIMIPFCLAGLCSLVWTISKILKNQKMMKKIEKIYIGIFLVFMFIMLTAFTVQIIIEETDYLILLFTIPFWIVWIFLIYKFFIKKN